MLFYLKFVQNGLFLQYPFRVRWPWGRDEEMIRKYIRDQEKEDERLEQLKLM